jgi:hypothetical protein
VAALKAAVGDLESLKKQASEAASYLQILRQWLPQIAATQQATGALTTQTQASVAQSQTDKEIGEALQALYQHGTPIPAAILQLMKARANELRPPANVPTPPRFPEPFVRPAPSAPLDQWMYPPARPTTPRGDGMATQTIGQEIVKRLLEGNGLLDKNFQTVIHLLDEQNNRQREIDYRLRNVESHARVAQ